MLRSAPIINIWFRPCGKMSQAELEAAGSLLAYYEPSSHSPTDPYCSNHHHDDHIALVHTAHPIEVREMTDSRATKEYISKPRCECCTPSQRTGLVECCCMPHEFDSRISFHRLDTDGRPHPWSAGQDDQINLTRHPHRLISQQAALQVTRPLGINPPDPCMMRLSLLDCWACAGHGLLEELSQPSQS